MQRNKVYAHNDKIEMIDESAEFVYPTVKSNNQQVSFTNPKSYLGTASYKQNITYKNFKFKLIGESLDLLKS